MVVFWPGWRPKITAGDPPRGAEEALVDCRMVPVDGADWALAVPAAATTVIPAATVRAAATAAIVRMTVVPLERSAGVSGADPGVPRGWFQSAGVRSVARSAETTTAGMTRTGWWRDR